MVDLEEVHLVVMVLTKVAEYVVKEMQVEQVVNFLIQDLLVLELEAVEVVALEASEVILYQEIAQEHLHKVELVEQD
tara:strand:+ start:414 stop:644 length:231 start_codon:yes stop_codon:yes gene_type:complete